MNAPAQICVARHGETDWNATGVLQGWLDIPINDLGREQARQLADKVAAYGLTRVYSSPLRRAAETADILVRQLRLASPILLEGLKERNFGAIQGIPKQELAELNPVLVQQILSRNPACNFEQGESMDYFAIRVLGALMEIGGGCAGERVMVITHGWCMDVLTRHVRGLPRSAILHLKRKNSECLWVAATSSSILGLDDAGAALASSPVA